MKRLIIIAALICVLVLPMLAQRRATPVKPTSPQAPRVEKKQEIDRSRLALKRDADGNEILVDTVTGKEFVDSAAIKAAEKAKPMLYPLFTGITAGVNVWDPVMRIFGQKYGIASLWVQGSLHNRYLPTVEAGLGTCNDTPSGMDYTYKSPVAPFFKLGCMYNFLYNSSPDYMAFAGVMYGFSPFKFSVDDVETPPGYWGEPSGFSIPSRACTAGYLQVQFGLRVKIVDRFSMGWTIDYHRILHESDCPSGRPMYIPGYGKRNGHIAGSISLCWTFGRRPEKAEKPKSLK